MFSFKIRHIPPDPSTLRLPEPPSPMPDQVDKMEQSMAMSSISQTKSTSSSSLRPPGGPDNDAPPVTGQQETTGSKAEEYRKWNERGREWVYGYVWFEQRKDRGISRGYMQVNLASRYHNRVWVDSVIRNHLSSSPICPFRPSLLVFWRRSLRYSSNTVTPHWKPLVTRLHLGGSRYL